MWGIVGGSVSITMDEYLFVCVWVTYSGGGVCYHNKLISFCKACISSVGKKAAKCFIHSDIVVVPMTANYSGGFSDGCCMNGKEFFCTS